MWPHHRLPPVAGGPGETRGKKESGSAGQPETLSPACFLALIRRLQHCISAFGYAAMQGLVVAHNLIRL